MKLKEGIKLCELAAKNFSEIQKVYPNAVSLSDTETDTNGFGTIIDNSIVIVFRGTTSVRDWLTDIEAHQMIYPYDNKDTKIRVHSGFMKAYQSVRAKVHAYLTSDSKPVRVYVLGHSLGGALATLCSVDIQYNFHFFVNCYTYGAPRVGNKAFADSYNRRIPSCTRTYLKKDLVPELPPAKLCHGYQHAGTKNPIGPSNIFTGLINWVTHNFKTTNIAAQLANHSTDLYEQYIGDLY